MLLADDTLEEPAPGQVDPDDGTAMLEIGLEPSPTFGGYQLLGRLRGRGSAGVYEAHDLARTLVALKRLENQRSSVEVERFKSEAELTHTLGDHPNIIPVCDIGEVDGRPYYTMPFMDGGTLVEWYRREKPAPEMLAGVMAQIARAVDHAHQPGRGIVLHRDLKPANILMDAAGKPYVADFGVAKRLDNCDGATANGIVGTLDYMAPEQALGESDKLTPAADIYSLGVVLYELLTNDVPVRGATVGQFLQRLWSAQPIVAPRKRAPGVHPGLENICLKCLENDPRRRYGSADELARDFERVNRRQRPLARAPSRTLRIARWIRCHPRAVYAVLVAMAVAAVTAGVLLMRLNEQDRILDANGSIASGQAGAALFQLREYADHAVEVAHLTAVRTILERGELRLPAYEIEDLVGGFDSLFVMTTDARILAQWPTGAPEVYQRTYTFRDYFRGAHRLAETGTPGAYVARAFRSESHGTLDFAISTPVLNEQGHEIGLVVGTLNAKSAFGAVRMQDPSQSGNSGRIITALIGPRGNDRTRGIDAPAPSDFTFVVHPGMDRGVEYPMRNPTPEILRQRFGVSAPPGHQLSLRYRAPLPIADYHDPIPGFGGEWLAALAPVGNTGFLILVETRKASMLSSIVALFHRASP